MKRARSNPPIASRHAWPRLRRAMRHLPHVPADADAQQTILRATAGAATPAVDRPARGWSFAAAAAIAVAIFGTWLWSEGVQDPLPPDAELARLDAEVEEVLVRIGLVFRETERIALDNVLGTDPRSPAFNPDPEVIP